MTIYQVLLRCDEECENYELERVMLETGIAERAIEEATILEDRLHHARIIIKGASSSQGVGYK